MTLVIGLTGGIGSGKSTVADLFKQRGVPIIDADVIARELTIPRQLAFQTIVAHFGPSIVLENGSLDRKQLRHIIFEHETERAWLENLLHPLIRERISQQLDDIHQPYCIAVIPLLFEAEPYPFIQRILVVDASEQIQIDRVVARDQIDKAGVAAILKAQINRDHRMNNADDVITNNGSLADLEEQVNRLHLFYTGLASS